MILKVRSPGAVIPCISSCGILLFESKCLVRANILYFSIIAGGGGWSQPSNHGMKAVYTLDKSPLYHRADMVKQTIPSYTHTYDGVNVSVKIQSCQFTYLACFWTTGGRRST